MRNDYHDEKRKCFNKSLVVGELIELIETFSDEALLFSFQSWPSLIYRVVIFSSKFAGLDFNIRERVPMNGSARFILIKCNNTGDAVTIFNTSSFRTRLSLYAGFLKNCLNNYQRNMINHEN